MKKFAIITFILGTALLLYGVWMTRANQGFSAAVAQKRECDVVYGLEPVNIREKATCVHEAEQVQTRYDRQARLSIVTGGVVMLSSSFVLVRRHRAAKRNKPL